MLKKNGVFMNTSRFAPPSARSVKFMLTQGLDSIRRISSDLDKVAGSVEALCNRTDRNLPCLLTAPARQAPTLLRRRKRKTLAKPRR